VFNHQPVLKVMKKTPRLLASEQVAKCQASSCFSLTTGAGRGLWAQSFCARKEIC
jgi:hypothetical protein